MLIINMVLFIHPFRLASLSAMLLLLACVAATAETNTVIKVNTKDYLEGRGLRHHHQHPPGGHRPDGDKDCDHADAMECPPQCVIPDSAGGESCIEGCAGCPTKCLGVDQNGKPSCNEDCGDDDDDDDDFTEEVIAIGVPVLAILVVIATTVLCIKCCRGREHRRYEHFQNSPFPPYNVQNPNIQMQPIPVYIPQGQQIPPAMPVQPNPGYPNLAPVSAPIPLPRQ